MQRVGLFVNRKKPEALAFLEELRAWLVRRKKEPIDNTRRSLETILGKSDLLICLGGDGTILHAAGKMKERSVPVLGVNLGGLGFLTGVKGREVFEELEAIFDGNYRIEERVVIEALVDRKARGSRRFRALNDVVVHREGLTRYLHIEVKSGGEALMNFAGDGVIVGTPTGSTAYSLSAGGPFVYPTLDSFVVTPLCAHALLLRPIVLPSDKSIAVSVKAERGKEKATLTVDGQEKVEISAGDLIQITQSNLPFRLIGSSKRSYLETLREKFGMVPLNARGKTSPRGVGRG